MKKTWAVFLCFFVLCAAGTAQTAAEKVADLIRGGLSRNRDEIEAESALLTESEKTQIYRDFLKNPAFPFCLNLIVGFGLGSFIQGDAAGGLISAGCDLLGFGLLFTGTLLYGIGILDLMFGGTMPAGASATLFGGLAIVTGSRIFESIRPFFFAGRYNAELRRIIGLLARSGVSLSFAAGGMNRGFSLAYTVALD